MRCERTVWTLKFDGLLYEITITKNKGRYCEKPKKRVLSATLVSCCLLRGWGCTFQKVLSKVSKGR